MMAGMGILMPGMPAQGEDVVIVERRRAHGARRPRPARVRIGEALVVDQAVEVAVRANDHRLHARDAPRRARSARSVRLLRSILPVPASGSSPTNSTWRGCWYAGALASAHCLTASALGSSPPARHDEGHRLGPLDLVGHGDHAGLLDARMALEHRLDLARVDVLAAAHEHVVGAADEEVEAVGVAPHDVAGDVVAVRRHDRGGLLRQVQIAGHQRRRPHLQHALVRVEIVAGHQPHVDALDGIAERRDPAAAPRAGAGPKATGPDSVVPQPFVTGAPGNAALTRSTSAWVSGAEPMVTRRTDERSVAASASGSWSTSASMVGTAGEPGAAVASDRLDVGARGEARQHDDAGPAGKRHDAGDPERVHVVERRGDEEALAPTGPASPAAGGRRSTARRRGSAARPWAGPDEPDV